MTAAMKPLAVVTGGSSGFGYHLAEQFVQAGYDVLKCAEDAGVTEAEGGRCHACDGRIQDSRG